jgi:two-component system sensor histidine kinase BarA
LGLVVADREAGERRDGAGDVLVVDASTYGDELQSLLATPESSRPALVVVATAADVEALHLRVLLHEKAIVLKPVHRIAFQEALAVASGMEVSAGASMAAQASTPLLRGHVLLVEDEAVNAAVAEGYLAALGCTSVWVKNGSDAVARSSAERFDLIFMDLSMPGMDGFAAARLIREREAAADGTKARLPIIALTAHDAANFRARVLEAQMDDILSKPYALEDCTKLLRRWLTPARSVSEGSTAASQHSSQQTSSTAASAFTATAVRNHGPALAGLASLSTVDAGAVGALKKLRGGSHTDLYSKLVDLFRTGSADSFTQLRAALNAGDLQAAAAVCHKLAASAANVGALAFGKQTRELERLCAAGEADRAGEIYQALHAAHAPLIDELIGHTMRATA